MPSAPMSAKTPSPMRVLTPMRLAPAAPANAPCGTASATNDEPRSTMKNPTMPATTATMVATVQVFTMKPENIAALPAGPGLPGARASDSATTSSAMRATQSASVLCDAKMATSFPGIRAVRLILSGQAASALQRSPHRPELGLSLGHL